MQVKVQLAENEARLIAEKNSFKNSWLTFSRLLNIPTESKILIPEEPLIEDEGIFSLLSTLSEQNAISTGLKNRIDVKQLKINIESAKLNLNTKLSINKPTLSLQGKHYWKSSKKELKDIDKDIDRQWEVSAQVSIPIIDGGLNREEVKSANLSLKKAEYEYEELIKNIHDDIHQLYEVPKQQLIEAETSYRRVKLQYEATKEESSLNDSKVQFEKAKMQLQNARDELKSIINELNKENIPYQSIGTISLVVESRVDEFDIQKIKLKQLTRIRGRSIAVELSGYILKIGDKVIEDPKAPYIEVISSIKNTSNAQLKHGLQVDGEIVTNCKENILCIPLSAILEKDDKKVVYVVEGNQAIMKQIEL